jgi:hypothetical protein
MRVTFFCLVSIERLVRRTLAALYSMMEIAVRPVEIDGAVYWDFDNCETLPPLGDLWVARDVALEQLDVIFANGCTKQLAKIGQRIMQVSGRENLAWIDDPADPDLIQIVVFQ